ncbi:MAG: Rrf2 family transcriptional regulator [Solirubrobacteraceae bacterium]|nr:Rrf2 family transcriptional regulator [Solirubrobacteraceae bacterium]
MIFTTKAEYGVRLLVDLGKAESGDPVALKAIAEHEGLPLAYLERIVALLRKAGIVESTRGARGGYLLSRDPSEIRMDTVIQALDGPIAPMSCFIDDSTPAELNKVVCSHPALDENGNPCGTKLLWTRVHGGVVRALQQTTLADLIAFEQGGVGALAARRPTGDELPVVTA